MWKRHEREREKGESERVRVKGKSEGEKVRGRIIEINRLKDENTHKYTGNKMAREYRNIDTWQENHVDRTSVERCSKIDKQWKDS